MRSWDSLAADPSRPGFLYAGAYQRGVAKSADGGESWNIGVEPGLSEGPLALLKIHPSRPDTLYVGLATRGDRTFRSTDGGRTWQGFARRITRDGLFDLGFDPVDPDVLYAANEQGLWKSRDTPYTKVAVPTSGTLIASRNCGLSRSTDDGRTWQQVIPCFMGDDLSVFAVDLWIDPEAPRHLYALMLATNGASGYGQFLAGSTDGGITWKTLEGDVLLAAVAPSDFRTLYVVDLRNHHLLRSTDGGESWRTVRERDPYPDFYSALAVDATDPDTLYVGMSHRGVLRSRNGGATLTPIGGAFEGARRATRLLFTDRNHPRTLWAAPLNGGLFWGRFE